MTATDLIVPGTITTLNTEVYVTEQLQILNSSTGTALNIIQNNTLGDVFNASNSTTQVFAIKNNGNIGIGTNTPVDKLHVVGNIVSTGTISSFYSDERLKIITDYIIDVLPTLDKINVFRYNCNDLAVSFGYDKKKKEIGLSAQEIKENFPELTTLAPFDCIYDNENKKIVSKSGENYLTINYERLVPILLQGIKELNNNYNDLAEKYNILENKNKDLDEKYNILENKNRELDEKYNILENKNRDLDEKYNILEKDLNKLKEIISTNK